MKHLLFSVVTLALLLGGSASYGQKENRFSQVNPCQVYADAQSALALKEGIAATEGKPCQAALGKRIAVLAEKEVAFLKETGAYQSVFLQAKKTYEGTPAESIWEEAAAQAITQDKAADILLDKLKKGKPLKITSMANAKKNKKASKAAKASTATTDKVEEVAEASAEAVEETPVTSTKGEMPAEEAEEAVQEAAGSANPQGADSKTDSAVVATKTAVTETAEKAAEETKASKKEFEDEVAWQMAIADGKLEDYKAYLEKYPEGKHVEEAKEKVEELEEKKLMALAKDEAAWMTATKINTLEEYQGYLKQYPEGRHSKEAKEKVEELTETPEMTEEEKIMRMAKQEAKWMQAEKSGKKEDYEAYLEEYPEGKHAKSAKEKIGSISELENAQDALEKAKDELNWKMAKSSNTLEAYKNYLKEYPEGIHAEKAKEKIAELEE